MRKVLLGILIGALLFSAGAAASGYLITNIRQIKPSVRRALKGNRGARGFRGRTGPAGRSGPAGAPGAAGGFTASNVVQVTGPDTILLGGGRSATAVATCPSGGAVLNGGWYPGARSAPMNPTVDSKPAGVAAWQVVLTSHPGDFETDFVAYAICGVPTG